MDCPPPCADRSTSPRRAGTPARLRGEGDVVHMDHAMAAARDALDIRGDQEATWAGLAALRDIRPSFDALYGVLDADQRRILDAMLDHGHRA
ncbi:MAG: hypothetical protein WD673_12845 [Alphaproteobacteria bacterium]